MPANRVTGGGRSAGRYGSPGSRPGCSTWIRSTRSAGSPRRSPSLATTPAGWSWPSPTTPTAPPTVPRPHREGRVAMSAAEAERCNQGRCSWWAWHQEQVARYEHARCWRGYLTPPAFRLADYQDFLADRLAHRQSAPPAPAREAGHERC